MQTKSRNRKMSRKLWIGFDLLRKKLYFKWFFLE